MSTRVPLRDSLRGSCSRPSRRLGERSERLEPCEIGVRVRPSALDARTLRCKARMVAWKRISDSREPDIDKWAKTERVDVAVEVRSPVAFGAVSVAGRPDIEKALEAVGANGLA